MRAHTRVAPMLLFLVSCAGKPEAPRSEPASRALPPTDAQAQAAPAIERRQTKIRHALLTLPMAQGEARVHHFVIPLADARVSYVDLKYQTPLVDALGAHDLLLNGGYWGYREKARVLEGLLLVNDQQLARQHAHGGVLELREGQARVVRGEDFKPSPHTALALQCNPRLVDDGKIIPKLEAQRRAARTALCVSQDRTQLEAYLSEDLLTLPELASFLIAQGCIEALNLDGGPSTAAVARLPDGIVTIGRGEQLPYGLAFTAR